MYMKDITLMELGNESLLENPKNGERNVINFKKFKLIVNSMDNLISFQSSSYLLKPIHSITHWLGSQKYLTDQHLMVCSGFLEVFFFILLLLSSAYFYIIILLFYYILFYFILVYFILINKFKN